MKQIIPFFWFDGNALEAAEFYVSIFPNSKLGEITYYSDGAHMPEGSVMTVSFTLDGNKFTALNGTPDFRFTEAVSFMVECDSAEEVDYFWEKLTRGGEPGQCGWLKDKFGLSWQVTPSELFEVLNNNDPEKAKKAVQALYKMSKIDINEIKKATE